MFNPIVNRFNKENTGNCSKERISRCDLVLAEMTEFANRDIALRYESDMYVEYCTEKTDGDVLVNLVLLKVIFSNKTYTEEWLGEKIIHKIIYMLPFLHKPYSNYVRNYAMDVFRIILSDKVDLDPIKLIITRNAIEESFDKNPIEENYESIYCEKFAEFSSFLSTFFSDNAKKFEAYENTNPFFRSKYERKAEHISGSIIGNAVGNSIGFLVEGQNSATCCDYVNLAIQKILHIYGLNKNLGQNGNPRYCKIEGNENDIAFVYGQYTEDAQCARELLMSIENGKLNVECFRKKMISLYGLAGLISWDRNSTVKSPVVSHSDIQTIQNMSNGVSWQEAGKGEGNGSVTRSVPLGALYMHRKDLCWSVADMQAVGTHNCPKVRACSVLIAETTRLAIENKVKPYARYNIYKYPRIFCKQLVSSIISIEPRLEKYILSIPDLIEARKKIIRESKLEYTAACISADRQIIKVITTESAKGFGDKLSNNGETISSAAVQSSLFSIYCFLCIPDFFFSSICMAIRSGGNTSATAAIVGGIVGGRLGVEEIPSYFVDKINDQGNYKSEELILLCQTLSEQKFVSLDQQPMPQISTWAPSPTFGSQQPSTFGSQPSTFGTQQPSTFGSQQPSTFGSQPSTFGSQPSTFGSQQPSTFGSQPSTFGSQQPSTFGTQQPSTFGTQQPSTFGTQQPSTFGSQPSTFGTQQPSTFGTQPSTFGTQPSTFGTQPSTFGSQPSTFGTQPSTFGSQPSTFGTQPSTFGTQPSMFGSQQTSMFGTKQTSTFGTQPSTFGTNLSSMFGAPPQTLLGTKP